MINDLRIINPLMKLVTYRLYYPLFSLYSEMYTLIYLLDKVNLVYYTSIDMDTWTPEKIKELRARLNLTQEAFGHLAGITRIYVNYLEKGVKRPSKTLCILFDCISKKHENENEKGGVDLEARKHRKTSKRRI
jgi:DNA-binding XRE family transcriptional regulator